MIVIEI